MDDGCASVSGVYHGHCYCGEVAFTVATDVVPNAACFCHCESCRRAHSAPLYQVVYIPVDSFSITKGKDLVKAFSKNADSVVRSFCKNCGSKISNVLPQKPSLGIGFFPALLEESVQHDLPDIFKAREHYLSVESVLDLEALHDGIERT